jgi:5-formyltetrahydrofolate cyclo-ligase
MCSSVASPSKPEWRDRFRAYRTSLSPSQVRAKSALIDTRAAALSVVARASTVHVYWPAIGDGEVDTRPLIQTLRGRGTTVVLPVVTSYDPATPTMEHRRYEGRSSLSTNRWGLYEPSETPRVAPDALDAVIVPGLGADRQGTRLGRGGGYYDAFLQDCPVPRILLTYDACLVDALPSAPHDVPVTTIVTERDVLMPDCA